MIDGSFQLVEKTNIQFDAARIVKEVSEIIAEHDYLKEQTIKQLMLTCQSDSKNPNFYGVGKQPFQDPEKVLAWQKSFNTFNPNYNNTYLETVWRNFPFSVGRVRIMLLRAHACYTIHKDLQPRFHIAVITNPSSFIVYPNQADWHHIPSDGYVYKINTHINHTAINAGDDWRVHLVFDSTENY
jgi:hypothetical protein